MGGGDFAQGNVTPSAEFNIYADPEAAAAVFACGVPIVMMPLDVTHKVLTTKERLGRLAAVGNNASEALVKMLTFYGRYTSAKYGGDGGPLHDPTTIAWLLRPDLFDGRMCNVEIEIQSVLTRGATVVDWWGVTDRRKNALVIQNADAEGFFKILTERVANLT